MSWYDLPLRAMKLGTMPAVVHVHGSDVAKIKAGNWIRIKECEGDKWHYVLVDAVRHDNLIVASR